VFKNKVLRRIFVPKRDEVTRGWTKLHNEELRDLYSSPSKIRIIKSRRRRRRWAGHVARTGEKRNAYRLLVGKPQGKRPPGRPRRSFVPVRLSAPLSRPTTCHKIWKCRESNSDL
jgi:hypothetical protein